MVPKVFEPLKFDCSCICILNSDLREERSTLEKELLSEMKPQTSPVLKPAFTPPSLQYVLIKHVTLAFLKFEEVDFTVSGDIPIRKSLAELQIV